MLHGGHALSFHRVLSIGWHVIIHVLVYLDPVCTHLLQYFTTEYHAAWNSCFVIPQSINHWMACFYTCSCIPGPRLHPTSFNSSPRSIKLYGGLALSFFRVLTIGWHAIIHVLEFLDLTPLPQPSSILHHGVVRFMEGMFSHSTIPLYTCLYTWTPSATTSFDSSPWSNMLHGGHVIAFHGVIHMCLEGM